jgi:mono/diheme cytochrome c family protein
MSARRKLLPILCLCVIGLSVVGLGAGLVVSSLAAKTTAKPAVLRPPFDTLGARATTLLFVRCAGCHGSGSVRGGLDLSTRDGLLEGGDHGPAIVPGKPRISLLYRLITQQEKPAMPPGSKHLTEAEVALIADWIEVAAPYPPTQEAEQPSSAATFPMPAVTAIGPHIEESTTVTAADTTFWSFQPLRSVTPPSVRDGTWARNPVDHFMLAAWESRGIQPNAEADKRTLVRRLSFDLLGLPPSTREIEAFLADTAPNAYERLVDRMLASPHYGEHWGRRWLDLARYADSDGYEDDKNRPNAYPYRDFVIQALNDDLPFDVFLRWQIAGDELAPTHPPAVAATGFATAGPYQTFFMKKKDRYDELDDIVSTLGSAMLGLTVGCARCHDHKNDPIPQKDYYGLQAVFAGSHREERYLVPDGGADYRHWLEVHGKPRQDLDAFEKPLQAKIRESRIADLDISEAEKELLRRPVDPSNQRQALLLGRFGTQLEVGDEVGEAVNPLDRQEWERLLKQVADSKAAAPPEPPRGLGLAGSCAGRAYFLERGDPAREREAVPPGFVTVLTRGRPRWQATTWTAWDSRKPDQGEPLPRTALACWLTDLHGGAARLAARVIVNRLWQHHLVEGLVRTPNDFGHQGDRPVFPELLDWLARELVENGWQLKHVHRLILCSSVYRQATATDPVKVRTDPDNRLFSRRRPQRLSAEGIRDALLAVGGNLNSQMYGPGIKPPIPADAIFATAPKHGEVWPANAVDGPATWRRSVYIVAKRSNPVPFLQTFDGPDAAASCASRSTTTVPTQALALMNDPFTYSQARFMAERVQAVAGPDPEAQIRQVFLRALARPPHADDEEKATRFLREQGRRYPSNAQQHAVADLCQVLFQSNEFLYID